MHWPVGFEQTFITFGQSVCNGDTQIPAVWCATAIYATGRLVLNDIYSCQSVCNGTQIWPVGVQTAIYATGRQFERTFIPWPSSVMVTQIPAVGVNGTLALASRLNGHCYPWPVGL